MVKCSVVLFWLALSVSGLAAELFTLDPTNSQLSFRVRQYVSVVTGKFTDFSGAVAFDRAQPERSRVEATISVKSIDTGIAARDHHLLAADFFDAEKYPTMTFKSNTVKLLGERIADVHGDLTMHGKTLPVVLRVELLAPVKRETEAPTWTVSTHLRRSEFGLKWSPVIEAASGISDEIDIEMRMVTPAR